MASKKLKKFLAAGLAAYAGSKMLGDKGSGVVGKTKEFRQSFNPKKKSMFQKIINMGPGKNATSKKGGTLADKVLSRTNTGMEMFGGAKYGGMMKAKTGTYVKASCKLGKNKKTLIT